MIRKLFMPLTCAVPLLAGEPTGPLSITKVGEALVSEDFSQVGLPTGWTVAKGKWEVMDGALVGSELATDQHAAVVVCQTPFRNAVLQFDFEWRGAKSFALSMNHMKGHLWRVTINANGASLIKDKDKKDPASTAGVIAESKVKLEPGKRYTLTAEIVGSQVAVRIGDQISLSAATPAFDVDKPNVRFVVAGESAAIRNFRLWQATPK